MRTSTAPRRRGAVDGRAVDLLRHRHRAGAARPGGNHPAGETGAAAGVRRDAARGLGRRLRADRRMDPAGPGGADPGLDRGRFPGLGRRCQARGRQPAGGRRRIGRHRDRPVLRPGGRVRGAVRGRGGRRAGGAARDRPARTGPGHQDRHRHLVRHLHRHRAQAHPGVRDDRNLRPGLVDRLTPLPRPVARLRFSRHPDHMPATPRPAVRRFAFLLPFLLLFAAGLPTAPALAMQAQAAPAAAQPAPAPATAEDPAQDLARPLPPPETDLRSRFDLAFDKLSAGLTAFIAWLPLLAVALLIVAFSSWLAGFVSRRLHLLRLRTDNPYMNGLIRTVVRAVIILFGVVVALNLLNATALVTAVLGSAGVVGLVLGFAFKDIAENYVAGILLSLRQPFAPGDLVVIDGNE